MDEVQQTLGLHQEEIAAIRTEVAVILQRTHALEVRTDRMMSDSAENRAEMRTALSDILKEIRYLRDYQKTMEGAKTGETKADIAQRWAIPAVISLFALAKTLGWL